MQTHTGIVLLCHGSRDPAWLAPFESIRETVVATVGRKAVTLACLQFREPSLAAAIRDLIADGAEAICVVPLFMSSGGHMARDVASQIERLRADFPHVIIERTATLGELPAVRDAIAGEIVRLTANLPETPPDRQARRGE